MFKSRFVVTDKTHDGQPSVQRFDADQEDEARAAFEDAKEVSKHARFIDREARPEAEAA